MSLQKINPRFIILLLLMIAAAAMRIPGAATLSPLSNFTPIGAMAIFGGAYFQKNWKAYAFPLLTLLASDIVINTVVHQGKFGIMYSGWYWTYAAFALMVLTGKILLKKITIKNIVIASIATVFIHWIVTSPACILLEGSMYPKNWAGYYTSLVAAIPYERNFLIGTLLYSGVMFGVFEWMKMKYHSLQSA
ncbi:DUF6580 family putative transport protein [Terrimonas alba]|uniref:DUF6580 family putative transport protein n=1 Tax=Terrimonas alba TaxID=3349636 RepID=UPI0035F2B082